MVKRDLPPRVFERSGSYYLVRAVGQKRVWTKLCRVREGLAVMYRALADLEAVDGLAEAMPRLVEDWMREVGSRHSKKTQADDTFRNRIVSESFAKFKASEIQPPDVAEFLRYYRERPRTHNAYRSHVRELMRFAEEKGYRPPGSNPVDAIRTMSVKARDRYITDSELRRIKVAAMYGDDGKRTRSGASICALIDMAYLTGQRIGDLLTLEWSAIGKHGIAFAPAKVSGSTGAKVVIEWTPRLIALVERIRSFKRQNMKFVFINQEGQPYTYWGASSAWRRAVKRAKIKNCHFHDIRARALTDKDRAEGMGAARTMGGHSTESQTADYVRHRTAKKTTATR